MYIGFCGKPHLQFFEKSVHLKGIRHVAPRSPLSKHRFCQSPEDRKFYCATPEQTQSAIGLALPTLLGALAKKGEDENACQQLHKHFQQEQSDQPSESSLSSLLEALGGSSDNPLAGLFGNRQQKVEQGLDKLRV